jgi:uncharacterized protein (DUF58 family)
MGLYSDPQFLNTLERLNIIAKRVLSEGKYGLRPGTKKGGSTEFADHKRYSPGDEMKYVDWNVYARHDQLFIKEFLTEDRVHVTIYVDSSTSMSVGTPQKFDAAKKLAASFSYIGLTNFDTVSIHGFSNKIHLLKSYLSGKHQIMEILSDLDNLSPDGTTDMAAAFQETPTRLKGKNVVILITDLCDRRGYRQCFEHLVAQKNKVNVLHILAEEEISPKLSGIVTLTDAESGRKRKMSVTQREIDIYRSKFKEYLREIEDRCSSLQISYTPIMAGQRIEEMITAALQKGTFIEISR